MIKIISIVILAEIFTAIGHTLFKKSTNTIKPYSLRGVDKHLRFLGDVLVKPLMWVGLFCMALGLIVWLIALAQGDLSLVFPLGSLQYILILFMAHAFLDERIDAMKAIGTLLVVSGIILITIS